MLAKDDPNIIFTGAIFGADKDTILRNAWVFCLPSSMEGLPISLLEGMSYGKVCIASDITADIYLSTSLFEGTSNSIMEAMNWSIPVVATNVGDNNQLIKDSWNGYLISIGDYKRLSEHLLKLLHDDKLRIEMGIRGNERLHNYSVERFVENYSKVLEK